MRPTSFHPKFYPSIKATNISKGFLSRLSALLFLLAWNMPATAASDSPLAGLSKPDERAGYCYYSYTINVKLTSRGRDKLKVLPMLQQLTEWKAAFDTRFSDKSKQSSEMMSAVQYFNEQASLYAKNNNTETQVAQKAIADGDLVDCNAELARFKQSGPYQASVTAPALATSGSVGKPSPGISVPENAAKTTPSAATNSLWNNRNLYGSWQATRGNKIQFVLWDSGNGLPEGLAAFSQPAQRCLGTVEVNTAGKLAFTPFEKNTCDGLDDAYFDIMEVRSNLARLTFVPAGSKAQLNIANIFYIKKTERTPGNLQTYVDKLQNSDLSLLETVAQLSSNSNDNIKTTIAGLKQGFQPVFKEAGLIGVWQGEFVDKHSSYPAEVAFWTSKPYRLNQLVGLVRFDDKLCATGILIIEAGKNVQWHMSNMLTDIPKDKCGLVSGNGSVQLDKTGSKIAVFVDAKLSAADGVNTNQCLQNLPNQGLGKQCYTVGLFQRADASPEMISAMQKVGWYRVKAPAVDDWKILKKNTAALKQLRNKHEQAMVENTAIVAVIKKEAEEVTRKQEAEDRQWRQEAANKKAADKERQQQAYAQSQTQAQAQTQSTGGKLIPPPDVSGPFDGLRGASFFNAIYKGDSAAVRAMTTYYQERKIKQRGDFFGNEPHWSDGIYNAATRSIQLTDMFMAVYLLEYGKIYKACLRKDAEKFEIVREFPGTVTTNMFGWEVARDYGYAEIKYFSVNKEFAEEFRRVGLLRPDEGMSIISDFIINSGGTDLKRDIITGTRQLMRRFDCNGKQIKRLEKNALKL